MSLYRPECPIIAVTPNADVLRSTCLNWGVYGVLNEKRLSTVEGFEVKAIEIAKKLGIKKGEPILITGGDLYGSTNFMKICKVEE